MSHIRIIRSDKHPAGASRVLGRVHLELTQIRFGKVPQPVGGGFQSAVAPCQSCHVIVD